MGGCVDTKGKCRAIVYYDVIAIAIIVKIIYLMPALIIRLHLVMNISLG